MSSPCKCIETNLLGYLYSARAAVRIFREQCSGVLVNVSSATAYVGRPSRVPMSPANAGFLASASVFAKR